MFGMKFPFVRRSKYEKALADFDKVARENQNFRGAVELLKLQCHKLTTKRDAKGRFIRGIV